MTAPHAVVTARLTAERERWLAQVAALHRSYADVVAASDNSNADDEHDPEGATIAFERSQLRAQIAAAQSSLDAVDEALEQVRAGGYGICSTCARPIAAARLEARPTARTCISCASR